MIFILFLIVGAVGWSLSVNRRRLAELENEVRWLAKSVEALSGQSQRGLREEVANMAPPVEATASPAPPSVPTAPFRQVARIAEPLMKTPETISAVEPDETPPIAPSVGAPPMAAESTIDSAENTDHEASLPDRENQPTSNFSFEDLFGRKLPIWFGGITLIVATILLVKYSIDIGLLSPAVRIVLGLMFGVGLIGAAEATRRIDAIANDQRIAQSLAGAGIGSLYAATLAAANLYHLISSATAFAGLSAVTGVAILLAPRFGPPTAVLGLVGGLATPALVQSDAPNIALLSAYLAIVIGSLTLLSRRQRWFWLGAAALIGGTGWTALLILMGRLDAVAVWAIGLLVLVLGFAMPALGAEARPKTPLRAGVATIASIQLAAIVVQGGFDALVWALYGLLTLAFVWLTSRLPQLRPAMVLPLATSLLLALFWPKPPIDLFTGVLAGMIALCAGPALWRLWRNDDGLLQAGQIVGIALGGFGVCVAQFHPPQITGNAGFGLLALAFAVIPATGALMGWRKTRQSGDARFAVLVAAAGLLVAVGALIGLPIWSAPIVVAAIACVLMAIAVRAADDLLSQAAAGFLGWSVVLLVMTVAEGTELMRMGATATVPHLGQTVARWTAATAAALLFSRYYPDRRAFQGLQAVAAVLGYGLVAQLIPAPWLALASAVALALIVELGRGRPSTDPRAASVVMLAIIALWAMEPMAIWLDAGLRSLDGTPLVVSWLPAPALALMRLLLPAGLVAYSLSRRSPMPTIARQAISVAVGVMAFISAHVLFKQVLSIADTDAFVRLGLIERTVWETLLIGIGYSMWHTVRWTRAGLVVTGAALAHALIYSMLLHNPLWSLQNVGPIPLLNLLLPSYAIMAIAPWLMLRMEPALNRLFARPVQLLLMVVVTVFAYSELRQAFAGSMLSGPATTPFENIGRSVLAIVLGIGYLLWGIRQSLRDWRLASLVLMLAAVAKVFLFDASGLEGLLRVASFMALGFSLIGIGWLYSRFLRPDQA
ncbi:MAG: DUF2339 domain-containing protein [Sphingomonas sp.]|nr:DUF2339 domain-containing protein [Sphingomonas sp.]